jgi:tetratricopeptide (TPR) repeat protein
VAIGAGVVAVAAVGASLLAPWLSLRWTERAVGTWRGQPAAAYADLERAADANPVSITPLLYAGVIAIERGELDRAHAFLERALEREDNWLAHYELAAIAAERGDTRAAMRQLRLARLKNVREPVITAAEKEVAKGERIAARELNGRLFEFPLFKTRRLS